MNGSGRGSAPRSERDGEGLSLQSVDHHDPANQRFTNAADQLDCLGRHDRADLTREGAKYSDITTGRDFARGRGRGEQVAQAHPIRCRCASGNCPLAGPEHGNLTVELQDRPPDFRNTQAGAGGLDEITGLEVIGAVHDDVVLGENRIDVLLRETLTVLIHRDIGVEFRQCVRRRLGLGDADTRVGVEDLTVQIRPVNQVVIDDAEGADTRGGQVEKGGGSEATGTDCENTRVLESPLPEVPNFFKHEMTGSTRQSAPESVERRVQREAT